MWKDIKMRCLWCCCAGGIQDDADTKEEESRREPKQETYNTNRPIAPLNKSALAEDCQEVSHVVLLHVDKTELPCSQEALVHKSALQEEIQELERFFDEIELSCSQPLEALEENIQELERFFDEIELSCSQPLEALVHKSALQEEIQELERFFDEIELSCSQPLEALEENIQELERFFDEIELSCSQPLEAPLNKSALDEAWHELLHVLIDEAENYYNPYLEIKKEKRKKKRCEAVEDHVHIHLDEPFVSYSPPLGETLKNCPQCDAYNELLQFYLDMWDPLVYSSSPPESPLMSAEGVAFDNVKEAQISTMQPLTSIDKKIEKRRKIKKMKWTDKLRCLWCWCTGGIQHDSEDTDTKEEESRIIYRKRDPACEEDKGQVLLEP
ncbi:uncharacterized protein LOC143473537 isoform X2 [Brachyhypopomus gauderio]|uniref:uncharacterized protein LOC143473537 isoform X2 n=1 Tax=Brachyhypopomus gauderio TaxID=698409 RepID=UPI0040437DC1